MPISGPLSRLLAGIVGFVDSPVLARGREADKFAFVEEGLGRPVATSTRDRWRSVENIAATVLGPRTDVVRSFSAPESPHLLASYLLAQSVASSDAEIDDIVQEYGELLLALETLADPRSPTIADEFLNSLADYGGHFDMVAAMEVPLDDPFLVKYAERRSLRWSRWGSRTHQDVVVADALTNHLTFKVLDPSTRIADFAAESPQSSVPTFGSFVATEDSQTRSIYAYADDRDYRARLHVRVGLLRRLAVVPWFVVSILGLAVAGLWTERPHSLADLTLIVGLSALAVSVLYAREPSTLGSRLRSTSSIAVAVAVVSLVVTAVALFVLGSESDRNSPPSCQRTEVASGHPGGCDGQEHR